MRREYHNHCLGISGMEMITELLVFLSIFFFPPLYETFFLQDKTSREWKVTRKQFYMKITFCDK